MIASCVTRGPLRDPAFGSVAARKIGSSLDQKITMLVTTVI
jgi:hypothetical protein